MNEEGAREKKPDEIYCPSCGKLIKKEAVVCPHCGVQVKELRVSAETRTLTPEEEDAEGRKQLGGIKVFYWFAIVVLALYFIVFVPLYLFSPQATGVNIEYYSAAGVFGVIFILGICMALYIIPLVGIIKRKSFAVPFTRVILVITMFAFPIGTIIGAVLWGRINHPLAKKYLHYGE